MSVSFSKSLFCVACYVYMCARAVCAYDCIVRLYGAVSFGLLLAQERQHHQNDVLNIGQEGEDRVGLVATMQVMM